MSDWARQPFLRAGRRALALSLSAALVMGACSAESEKALWPDSTLSRPEFSLTTEVSGEWIGEELIGTSRSVVAFIDTDDGPLALVRETQENRRVRPYALTDEGWQPAVSPISGAPDDSRVPAWLPWKRVSSVIAINGTVVAVGPNVGTRTDRPLSFVVGGDEIVEPEDSSPAWLTSVAKSVAGDGTAIAIGTRNGQAVAWRSTDGFDWSEVSLPLAAGHSMQLIDVAFADDRWVILGEREQELVVMVGRDATDWQTTVLSFPSGFARVKKARLGHRRSSLHVIGTGQPRVGSATNHTFTWTSTDGVTWGEAERVPLEVFGDGQLFLREPQPTAASTMFIGRAGYRADDRYCYEPELPCRVSVQAIWIPDEDSWSMLVPPAGTGYEKVTAAAFIDNTLYVGMEWGHTIYRWSPNTAGALPRAVPFHIQPPVMTLPLASEATQLEPGVVYAWPLPPFEICYTVADEAWKPVEVTAEATDTLDDSQAVIDSEIFGTAELVGRTRIEYAIPGYGPIAYFEQLPNQGADANCGFGANL